MWQGLDMLHVVLDLGLTRSTLVDEEVGTLGEGAARTRVKGHGALPLGNVLWVRGAAQNLCTGQTCDAAELVTVQTSIKVHNCCEVDVAASKQTRHLQHRERETLMEAVVGS